MREPAKTFKDLIVWQRAHQLVLAIYKMSATFPKHELYGLVSQIRRASVSIAANITEGFRKKTSADKANFLNISQGSLEEVRVTILFLLKIWDIPTHKNSTSSCQKSVNSLHHIGGPF